MCLDRDEIGGSCFGLQDASRLRPMAGQHLLPLRSPNKIRETVFSRDRIYRYTLWRYWNSGRGYINFIGLNPSTADERKDDPTIRKCIAFAKQWGFEALCMTNLFAYRATDPRKMKGYPKPIGPDNDRRIVECAKGARTVVAAWGKHGQFMGRDEEVWKIVDALECLGTNKDGSPKHPLYLPLTSELQEWYWSPKEPF